jgi:hypothetical protein
VPLQEVLLSPSALTPHNAGPKGRARAQDGVASSSGSLSIIIRLGSTQVHVRGEPGTRPDALPREMLPSQSMGPPSAQHKSPTLAQPHHPSLETPTQTHTHGGCSRGCLISAWTSSEAPRRQAWVCSPTHATATPPPPCPRLLRTRVLPGRNSKSMERTSSTSQWVNKCPGWAGFVGAWAGLLGLGWVACHPTLLPTYPPVGLNLGLTLRRF